MQSKATPFIKNDDSVAVGLRFVQGKNDFCVTYSLCSALYYWGEQNEPVYSEKTRTSFPHDLIGSIARSRKEFSIEDIIHNIQKSGCSVLSFPRHNRRKSKKRKPCVTNKTKHFDIFEDYQPANGSILWGTLHANRGMVKHMIAIYDQLIFDPNYQHAMQLTKENLDLSCNVYQNEAKFEKFEKLYVIEVNE